MFWTVLAGYLAGWLLVNLIFNRVLARLTRNVERLETIKAVGQKKIAQAVVDEIEARAPRDVKWP